MNRTDDIEYFDIDSLPTYTKQELAEHQLNRAICLLLDENDIISAITLAGAAEEILGNLVEVQGGRHSLESFINDCITVGKLQIKEDFKRKDFAEIANHFKNELKHYSQGNEITVAPECAHEIIDRAVENLWMLSGRYTEEVERYLRVVKAE